MKELIDTISGTENAFPLHTLVWMTTVLLALDSLTRIVVTHALEETLPKKYDCILALKCGRIAESGNSEDLMEKKGYFYSLFTVAQ